ncbi:MAG: peptidase M22 [Clostridia bacterium]|nr:peptidase M22 [Clostridia bacterium]
MSQAPWCLGIDTSNYTTSVAACTAEGEHLSLRTPFDVKEGARGVRQSDAVFLHTKELPALVEQLMQQQGRPPAAVAVSDRPRDVEGSYMPCFLAGLSVARSLAAALDVPLFRISHQRGHLLAALLGSRQAGEGGGLTERKDAALRLTAAPFYAFHVSGGTCDLLAAELTANGEGEIRMIGTSADLHAGQLVDRCGVKIGLKFPCGPALEQLSDAAEGRIPPMRFKPTDTLHLSGLENKFEALLKDHPPKEAARWLLESLANALRALTEACVTQPRPLLLAGGVLSNRLLRARLSEGRETLHTGHAYAADNACGVAWYGAMRMGGLDDE